MSIMPYFRCFAATVLLLSIINSNFSASVSHPNCLLGCSCSNDNAAAVCCLLPADGTLEPMRFQADLCYVNDSTDLNTRWPSINSCLPSWRQLQVRLTRSSWPNIRPVASHPSSSCTERLERLVLVGTSASDDGLLNLQSVTLRNLFFQKLGVLQLERLTVHQTQLRKIEDGFIDQLRAIRLRDVEISRNPNLTSVGLGVGWLAYAPHLRLLDLSRNKLTVVELAKWGFPPEGNTALSTLLLSGNQIAYLKPKTFERASNLIKLDLSDNLLSSVSLDVFSGLESLKILNLRGNRLTLPGLNLGSVSLLNTLPNLVHLQLSANPLLTANSTLPHWWLTGPCPRQLTKISLDELTSGQPVSPDKLLTLPPISWDQCPSLTELALPKLPTIPCLSQSWLGLAPEVQTIPERFRIRPASLQLCPPSTALPEAIASVQRSQPSSPLTPYPLSAGAVILIEPTTLSSMHAGNGKTHSEPWSEDADSVHYSRTLHILRLRGAGISPWILFVVLFVLFFAVVSLVIWGIFYCVRNHRGRRSKHSQKRNNHASVPDTHNGICSRFSNMTAYPDQFLTFAPPLICSKPAYSPLNLSVNGDCLEYPCSPRHQTPAGVRLLSPTDSGMGDITPINFQHSIHNGPSPSPSHASFQLSRNLHTPLACNPMRFHVSSLTSLRSTSHPARAVQPSYAMCSSFLATPQKLAHAATSTENMSLGPDSSIFDDPTEECAAFSVRTVSRNEKRDLLPGHS
ncbi:hypothetical protein CRM22_006305 [Opisthorchis felineus]|uniref:LRRCT domain-containing protein n=1 Tax=Opisthorchis felineus TaxID=147828 RepID=A0A4S2LUC3_OPIFE|nr:hypothetical protein CRM22_006305 [Opisthorchis felineus]